MDVDPNVHASPSKRGFFSRERKSSATRQHGSNKSGHSPLINYRTGGGSGSIGSTGSFSYGQYSKSQSDLHSAGAEFPSPMAQSVDLPPVPALPQHIPSMHVRQEESSHSQRSHQQQYLRSPSPSGPMARSVEDLNSNLSGHTGSSNEMGLRSPSPQHLMYSSSPSGSGAVWGEHGVPAQSWGRPSDLASTRSPGMSNSRAEHIPLSAQSQGSTWIQRGPSPTPDQGANHGHARKSSKHGLSPDNFFGGGSSPSRSESKRNVATGLASSFSLGQVAAGASNVMDKLRGPSSNNSAVERQSSMDSLSGSSGQPATAVLPPGATHVGFLNRNGNVSLSLNQLGGGREKEKDITKGWKPYKVILKDGSLVFFKPPSGVSDELKGTFPTTVVRNQQNVFRQGQQPLDAEALKQSGLKTQDLLQATSSTSSASRSPPSSPPKRANSALPPLPAESVSLTGMANLATSANTVPENTWKRAGAHPDLELVSSLVCPPTWAARVRGGTLEALTHELVFASQKQPDDSPDDTGAMIQVVLLAALISGSGMAEIIPALTRHTERALQVSQSTTLQECPSVTSEEEVKTFKTDVQGRAGWIFDVLISHFADAIDGNSARLLEDFAKTAGPLDVDVSAALADAQSPAARPSATNWRSQRPDQPRPKLASIARGSLSAADLLSFEPADVAEQIQIFHADRCRAMAVPRMSIAHLLVHAGGDTSTGSTADIFSFNGTSPHYLTKLILDQVLDVDEGTQLSASQDGQQARAAAKHRASLLRHWIAIASYLISFGDITGWVAILSAICSRAIARLEQTWALVAEEDRTLIASSWAPKLAKMKWNEEAAVPIDPVLSMASFTSRLPRKTDGKASFCLPYLGDSYARARQVCRTRNPSPATDASNVADRDRLPVAALAADASGLYGVVEKWRSEQGGDNKALDAGHIRGIGNPIVEMQQMLEILAAGSVSNPRATIASYLDASLQLEPRRLGNVDLRWRPPLPANITAKALMPLIFPEALPNLDLLDRQEVIATATASNASSGRDTSMSTSSSRQDLEATVRANKYVRSPLSGTPLIRASVQSLARSKTYPPTTGGRSSRPLPFSEITEWGISQFRAEDTLFHIGSDLVLQAIGEPPASGPSTPMTSKRFSQELSRGSRPVSQISKRSSLPASNRSSYIEPAPPVHVMVKAATLERLVDILVLGVSDLTISPIADDNSETPLQSARRPRATMDLTSYRTTFLATYKSMCSPLVLFEFLRKRFLAAVNAAREVNSMPQTANASRFPSWSLIDTSASGSLEPVDWDFVGRVRYGIISVLKLWVFHHTQDFTDDADLYAALLAFSDQVQNNSELSKPDGVVEAEGSAKVAQGLQDVVIALRERCMKVNARRRAPAPGRQPSRAGLTDEQVDSAATEFDFDGASPAALVAYMECVAAVFFHKITDRDLLIVAELFERQGQDPLGWHLPQDPARDPPIAAMYKLLEYLLPPHQAQQSQQTSDSIYQRLPATIRDACAAQSLLRGWIAVHITEPRIGVQRRQARLEKLIDAVWLCRARMLNARTEEPTATTPLAASAPFQDATVGSYIESVILGSLNAPESRTFTRAWEGVCHARGGNGEGLNDLLPDKANLSTLNSAALTGMATPDIGWLLRCLAQAVSRKSPLTQSNSTLVDFERSVIICNLIESSLSVKQDSADPAVAEMAGARLNAMRETLRSVQWDGKAFKEEANKEAMSVPPLPAQTTYRAHRPLQRIVQEQAEKQQRDVAAHSTLVLALQELADRTANPTRALSPTVGSSRSPLLGPQSVVGRSSTSNASSQSGGAGQPSAAEKRSRRVTALFRGAVRQTGLMGNNAGDKADRAEQPPLPRSYNELLNAVPISQKPALSVGLTGAHVAAWNNTQRSWVFHLTSQEGSHLLLQAPGHSEMTEWLSQLEKTIKELPAPVAKSSEPKKSAQMTRGTKSSTFVSLYETDINQLVEKEGRAIPLGLERMLSEIEARGLREQGIYRISGAKSSIEGLKQAYSMQPADSINLQQGEFSDVHTIAGAVKLWYRDLPNPAIPFASYHRMIEAESIENHDDRLYAIRDAIWDFPKVHFDLLRRTSEHLTRVAEEGEHNLMLPHNLGLVFGTSLLKPPPSPSAVSESFANLGKQAHVVKLILTYHDWLFEPEPEHGEAEENEAGADVATKPETDNRSIETTGTAANPSAMAGEVSTVAEEPEEDEVEEVTAASGQTVLKGGNASAQTDNLLAELQGNRNTAGAALPAMSAAQRESSTSSTPTTPDVFLTDGEDDVARRSSKASSTGIASRSLNIADASSSGQAIPRPENSLSQPRHGGREESVYADALEVALDSPAANLFARGSLLPDEAMLDIIRMMGTSGEPELGGIAED